MLLVEPATTDIRPLRAHCTGDVVMPGERVWDEVLATWAELPLDAEPVAVVFPAGEFDLAAVLAYVRYAGLVAVTEDDDIPADLDGVVLVQRPGTLPPWARR